MPNSPKDHDGGATHRAHLNAANWPAWRDHVRGFSPATEAGQQSVARTYPGYPKIDLPKASSLRPLSLRKALYHRRSPSGLAEAVPPAKTLGTLLAMAHGFREGHGTTPSAGNLQSLHLYLTPLDDSWLPMGAYFYHRAEHRLSRVADGGGRDYWSELVPSLHTVDGGGVLVIAVSDQGLLKAKYERRATMFGYLEAGHVMQNLGLVAAALDHAVVPLGAFFEAELGRALQLSGGQSPLSGDLVVYAGLLGGRLA